ncbi:transcriptional regulation of mitochondrial recombination-domain-containing protein [Colletotrichum phormii]|uniref:Large ribosomal subunit protein mL67 n=1 Tax=Colletotrichum phormii TaxID=359342 RepID=A0AAJ0EFR9_9PEZI|nr:transcriptional regulation of mitochondrial recombination-domain-containing protein [Colletotrichum phormii]KAK1637284.1 transcriptional regulation of mitochondrial recombination-domain-containing protein [Colletotrichum phormii]
MNSVPVFRFSKLSFGVARTSIRHGHTRSRRRTPQHELTNFEPGHGEQIWVWSHLTSNQVIYSHTKQLESHRALKQLPFNGKKSKPAKLRRDYWEPMALIQLPAGAGAAGQSVFQKLREFRRMHELAWEDDLLYREHRTELLKPKPIKPWGVKQKKNDAAAVDDVKYSVAGEEDKDAASAPADGAKTTTTPEDLVSVRKIVRNRHERSLALNDQRANSIADMAAVLAGFGRGNRLVVSAGEKKAVLEDGEALTGRKWSKAPPAKTQLVAAGQSSSGEEEVQGGAGTTKAPAVDQLLPATIYWANEDDRNFAQEWTGNVTHDLFQGAKALLEANQFDPEEAVVVEEPKAVEEPEQQAGDDTNFSIKEPASEENKEGKEGKDGEDTKDTKADTKA